jgi:Uma2 family endonuclease
MYDLPSEHPEDGLPDEFHLLQPRLLNETFVPPGVDPGLVFTATDLYVYFDEEHPQWHKRPDWFAVIGVPRRVPTGDGLRLSYVMWQERVPPLVVVDLLSPETKREDLGQTVRRAGGVPTKWEVYEQVLGVRYYVVFDRITDELRAFELRRGRYEPARLRGGRLWVRRAGMSLGLWQGSYDGVERLWLRWFDREGNPIPNNDERAEAERQARQEADRRAEAERQARERAEAERDRLRKRLRKLGVDPDSV